MQSVDIQSFSRRLYWNAFASIGLMTASIFPKEVRRVNRGSNQKSSNNEIQIGYKVGYNLVAKIL